MKFYLILIGLRFIISRICFIVLRTYFAHIALSSRPSCFIFIISGWNDSVLHPYVFMCMYVRAVYNIFKKKIKLLINLDVLDDLIR